MESCRAIYRPTYSFVSIVMHILGGASAGRTLRTRCGNQRSEPSPHHRSRSDAPARFSCMRLARFALSFSFDDIAPLLSRTRRECFAATSVTPLHPARARNRSLLPRPPHPLLAASAAEATRHRAHVIRLAPRRLPAAAAHAAAGCTPARPAGRGRLRQRTFSPSTRRPQSRRTEAQRLPRLRCPVHTHAPLPAPPCAGLSISAIASPPPPSPLTAPRRDLGLDSTRQFLRAIDRAMQAHPVRLSDAPSFRPSYSAYVCIYAHDSAFVCSNSRNSALLSYIAAAAGTLWRAPSRPTDSVNGMPGVGTEALW